MIRLILFPILLAGCFGSTPEEAEPIEPVAAVEAKTPAQEEAKDEHSALAPLPGTSLYQLKIPLLDQDGKTVDLTLHRGHPTIVAMFYASCPMACPTMIEDLRRVEAKLPDGVRDDLRVLLVSLDPERDGPELFKEIIRAHDLDVSRWHLGRAEPHDVRTLSAALGIQFRKIEGGDLHHETLLTLVDRDGVPITRLEGLGRDTEAFQKAIVETSRR